MIKGNLLVENHLSDDVDLKQFFKSTIVENAKGEKVFKIMGPMIVCEKKNRNGRIYKKDMMQEQIEKFNKLCSENHLSTRVGCDHPVSEDLPLKETVGRITKLWESKSDSNVFEGEVEIFPNSMYGGTIIDMSNRGMMPGFSTRALGSVGNGGVVENVSLISVDVVSDPSAEVYAEQKMFENKLCTLTENHTIVEAKDEPKDDKNKEPVITEAEQKEKINETIMEVFNEAFNTVNEYANLKVSKELKMFAEELVDINGKDSAVKILKNIQNRSIKTFDEDLEKLGYDVNDKKQMNVLSKVIKAL